MSNEFAGESSTGTSTLPAQPKTKAPKSYNVILLDDNDHTYDYVIRMITTVFGFAEPKALEIARTVDREGRAILLTTNRERAEFKQEQVHSFGSDPLIPRSKGSMTAILEPAC